MSDLILGTADGYGLDDIWPFIRSLSSTGYEGALTLFTRQMSADATACLRDHGAELRQYLSCSTRRGAGLARAAANGLFAIHQRLFKTATFPRQRAIVRALWDCTAYRFFLYRDLLLTTATRYERVMLTDVADVFFQANPFQLTDSLRLLVTEEYPDTKIGSAGSNRRWVQEIFGPSILAALEQQTVICAGVTLGTRDGILDYLNVMCRYLARRHGSRGFDQGVHNYLVRTGHLPQVTIRAYGEGPVLHLGTAPFKAIRVSSSGHVLLNDGTPSPVVHQHNRHPNIAAGLLTRLR